MLFHRLPATSPSQLLQLIKYVFRTLSIISIRHAHALHPPTVNSALNSARPPHTNKHFEYIYSVGLDVWWEMEIVVANGKTNCSKLENNSMSCGHFDISISLIFILLTLPSISTNQSLSSATFWILSLFPLKFWFVCVMAPFCMFYIFPFPSPYHTIYLLMPETP